MNLIDIFPASTAVWTAALGGALVQFLWQGAVVAGLLLAFRASLNRATPSARYRWNCLGLFSLPLVFTVTLLVLHSAGAAGWNWFWRGVSRPAVLPYLAGAWAVGVLSLALYSLGGWVLLRRARRGVDRNVPEEWKRRLASLRQRMGVRAEASLGVSRWVPGVCVAGWWRPLILLPLSALAAMPPDHVEAVLAHELAHIRRHDYLVNLLQRGVEVVFFYHPAVWWISRQVAEEREQCCDDLAIAACGDRIEYARALVEMAQAGLGGRAGTLALAIGGGSLRRRIGRIVGLPVEAVGSGHAGVAWTFAVTLAVTVALGLALLGSPHAMPGLPSEVRPAPALATAHFQTVSFHPKAAVPVRLRSVPPARKTRPGETARRRMEVTFTLAAYEVCAPRSERELEIVRRPVAPGVSLDVAWVSVRTVMQCEPVIQPVAVWKLTT